MKTDFVVNKDFLELYYHQFRKRNTSAIFSANFDITSQRICVFNSNKCIKITRCLYEGLKIQYLLKCLSKSSNSIRISQFSNRIGNNPPAL